MGMAVRDEIYIGSLTTPLYYFDDDTICYLPTTQGVAMVGQELSIDTFLPVVSDRKIVPQTVAHFRSSDGKEIETALGQLYAIDVTKDTSAASLLDLPSETPLWYYHNGTLVGLFYIMKVLRQGKNKYQLQCVSAIGLLDNKYHGGGLFEATTFGVVLQHILAEGLWGTGSSVIPYEIDDDVAELAVSGWLPHASKRDNLYQLMLANGVNIVKNIDGTSRFTFVYQPSTGNVNSIPDTDIFIGGSVEYTKPYSQIQVLEHTYVAITTAERITLLDNADGLSYSNTQIWFENAPIIVLTIEASSGLTIHSMTENGAVVSGTGVITGVPYTHTTRTVQRINTSATEEKTVVVDGCTMVNLINSENLVNRLYAFYCPSTYIKVIKNSIRYTDQRCGKAYTFHNPYGEEVTAFLASIDAHATSILKAECEFYASYEPAGQQGLFSHVIMIKPVIDPEDPEGALIYEGDVEIPAGVETIKVVLISGGPGGSSGLPGQNGSTTTTHTDVSTTEDLSAIWYGAEGGDGGQGGQGGQGGLVKIVTIENPANSYHYVLGEGGEGGNGGGNTSTPGSAGTHTEFGIQESGEWTEDYWSTEDEDASRQTVYEPINDLFFALPGHPGIRGGKGGARNVSDTGILWTTDGEDVTDENGTVFHGGRTGMMLTSVDGLPEANIKAYGGNGAGAAVGLDRRTHPSMDGGSDQAATWEVTEDE